MNKCIKRFDKFCCEHGIYAEYATEQSGKDYKVYFVTDGDCIKIGMAHHVMNRLRALRTTTYRDLKVLFVIHCEGKHDALNAEKFLHNLFKEQRVAREWFDIKTILKREMWEEQFDSWRYVNQ